MSEIFISYDHEDRPSAETLAKALQALGWSVWWDRTIPAGRHFDEVIEEGLSDAKVLVVLWSKKSVKSRWVRNEAEEGAAREILVPVLIEGQVAIPLAFRRIQAANLVGWDGSPEAASFYSLVADLAQRLGPPPNEEQTRRRQTEGNRSLPEAAPPPGGADTEAEEQGKTEREGPKGQRAVPEAAPEPNEWGTAVQPWADARPIPKAPWVPVQPPRARGPKFLQTGLD